MNELFDDSDELSLTLEAVQNHYKKPIEKIAKTDFRNYIAGLYLELKALVEDGEISNDEENNKPKVDVDLEKQIPFVIVREKGTYEDFQCPYCQDKTKILIDNYSTTKDYYSFKCTECGKTTLTRLVFTAKLNKFLPLDELESIVAKKQENISKGEETNDARKFRGRARSKNQ